MRRRMVVLSAAVTSMVAIAFLVPLFVLVSDLAYDRAVNRAERDAEGVARVLAVLVPRVGIDDAVADFEDEFSTAGISIVVDERTVLGEPPSADEDLTLALGGTAFRNDEVPGGVAVYVPVPRTEGPGVVVRAFVGEDLLSEGVTGSWITLSGLGLVLTVIAIFVADRLGRSVVRPVRSLSASTARLGEGDLSVRVTPQGPAELREVGTQFNRLAERITKLLQHEREQAADLSHRLRTPLTSVRLDIEALEDGVDKERLLDDLAELERMVTFVIEEARRPIRAQSAVTDLSVLVADRIGFWGPLAEDQGRTVTSRIHEFPLPVRFGRPDGEAMIDAVLGNVFSHTDDGVPIDVALARLADTAILRIEDAGPGFPDLDVIERGRSGGSSTGLGLDIARRTAESAGGSMMISKGQRLGGAVVELRIPLAE
ncbi:MAG: HAMP domain-containing protein [Acidimicrobiia bacterium]